MKKSLLFAASALVAGAAFADDATVAVPKDPASYEVQEGMALKNRFLLSEYNSSRADYAKMPWMAGTANRARTACIANYNDKDVVVIAHSVGASGNCELYLIDIATGTHLKTLVLSLDGAPYKKDYAVNQIGCDDFGHVWVKDLQFSTWTTPEEGDAYATPANFYTVDLSTGEMTLAASVAITEDDSDFNNRCDYCDLVGDITREEARCAIVLAPNTNLRIFGWEAEQGDDFEPMFDGYACVDNAEAETYPAGLPSWSTATTIKIIKDDANDFSAQMFYIDGFATCPVLYDRDLQAIDGFQNAESKLAPKENINGICDIPLNGKKYMAYAIDGHSGGTDTNPHHQIGVCSLNDAMEFSSLNRMWLVPEAGLGNLSDTGTRVLSIGTKTYKDANGVEGAYIMTYKCMNGVGVYTFAPEDWVDPNGDAGVSEIVADDVNAPIEYFNLNGVKVNGELVPGLYITRQGNKVAKQVVK